MRTGFHLNVNRRRVCWCSGSTSGCCHVGLKRHPLWNTIDRKQRDEAEACLSALRKFNKGKKINIQGEIIKKMYRAKRQRAAGFITFHRDCWQPVTWGSNVGFITMEIMAAVLMSGCDFMSTQVIHTHCAHTHTYTGTRFPCFMMSSSFRIRGFCFWGSWLLAVLLLVFSNYIGSAMPLAQQVLSCVVNMTLKKQWHNDTPFRKVFQSVIY